MKFIHFGMLLVMCGMLQWTNAREDPIAVVIKSRGQVTVQNQDAAKAAKISRGTPVYAGSRIRTGEKSFAIVTFIDDASRVRIRANSNCVIRGEQQQSRLTKNIFVEVGTVLSKVTSQKSRFRVSTPTSVASVKGTVFWTKQELNGPTYFFGEEGIIEISNESGAALLKSGETCLVETANSKPIVYKTRAGEKPVLDEDDASTDEFDLEFKDNNNNQQNLKFKARTKN